MSKINNLTLEVPAKIIREVIEKVVEDKGGDVDEILRKIGLRLSVDHIVEVLDEYYYGIEK